LIALERTNRVAARWTSNDEQYQAAVQIQVVSKCKQLVEKMKPLSQERLFLLKLKEKYFGNICTYNVTVLGKLISFIMAIVNVARAETLRQQNINF
jgi:hypothetical protein